jgi:predicted nucleic acid-binding protein
VGLLDDLGAGPVGVDTSIFVYFIEADSRFLPIVRPLFVAAHEGRVVLVTTALTLMEVLVMPYRAGDDRLAARYEAFLSAAGGVRLVPIDPGTLRAAARIRATQGARTPDALQLAAALGAGCTSFVTNDRRLPTIGRLRVLQLGAYAA